MYCEGEFWGRIESLFDNATGRVVWEALGRGWRGASRDERAPPFAAAAFENHRPFHSDERTPLGDEFFGKSVTETLPQTKQDFLMNLADTRLG